MLNIYQEGLCSKKLKNKIGICTGDFDNLDSAFKLIADWAKSQEISIPYYRYWRNENGYMIIDYGSHSKFIILEEVKNGTT